MGAKCCAGHEAKDTSSDAAVKPPKDLPTDEEMIKPNAAPADTAEQLGSGNLEFQVLVYKKEGGPPLGIDVDLSDGVALVIERINPGLIAEWNTSNPAWEVLTDDRLISVNGSTGSAQELAERCQKDSVLQLVFERLID